jgi:nucleotide-binding universal stress UspA family protein
MIEKLAEEPRSLARPCCGPGTRDNSSVRSILLHIADDDSLEPRTQVALDLARAFGGHLTCLQAVPAEYGVPGEFYGTVFEDLAPALREAAKELRHDRERRLAAEDVTWSWDVQDGRALEHLLRKGSLSDLVVVGNSEPLSGSMFLLAHELVTRLRTPMMLVPDHVNGLDCGGTAVVAWNGSAEASRALKAAIPLLTRARSVVLASVLGEADTQFDLPAVEGAEYLSRHGISCEMTEFTFEHGSVAEVLTDVAARREAAYLVMGAYSRPRLVETVLGGVTRELFINPPLPIFTCH